MAYKILRVCNSESFPPILERDPDYVYFVYDKMTIYLGQTYYSDPFCIVEKVPETDGIEGMLYITMDGKMKTIIDSKIIDIGEIESKNQLKYLLKAGTTYFMKAESRYLDPQTKTLQLPFQNGSYQISVNMAKDIMIDKNTIIRFNPDTNCFEIDGDEYEEVDKSNLVEGLQGSETDTTITDIRDQYVRVNVKISEDEGNLLESLESGLYASLSNYLRSTDLDVVKKEIQFYESHVNSYMAELKEAVNASDVSVSEDNIMRRIESELNKYHPDIKDIIDNYDQMAEYVTNLHDSSTKYTDEVFARTKEEIQQYVSEQLAELHPWDTTRSFLKCDNGSYKNNYYGGSYSKLYQSADIGKEFMKDIPLMNEIVIQNRGNKKCWVRVHIAIMKDMIVEERDPTSSANIVSIDVSKKSLVPGGWNWSISKNKPAGKLVDEMSDIATYTSKINGIDYMVYVCTYETAIEPNQKTIPLVKSITLHTEDINQIKIINDQIQSDQWEFPLSIETVDVDEDNNDPFEVFENYCGAIGLYNPFNSDEYHGEYKKADEEVEVISYKQEVFNKPKINGAIIEDRLDFEDIGLKIAGKDDIAEMTEGTFESRTIEDKVEEKGTKFLDFKYVTNKPTINGVELVGSITISNLFGLTDETYINQAVDSAREKVYQMIREGELSNIKFNTISDPIDIPLSEVHEEVAEELTNDTETSDIDILDWNEMNNVPTLNGVELKGNLTSSDLGISIMSIEDINSLIDKVYDKYAVN